MIYIQCLILVAGTIYLLFISRKALRIIRAHGFYRFFVFESTMLLVVWNIPFWVIDPFSVPQSISWLLLVISLVLVVHAFDLLRNIGGSRKRDSDSANYQFENTVHLVNTGIYKYIRHPMYSSLLFLCFGAFIKDVSVISIVLIFVAIVSLVLTAKTEEKENIEFFGNDYREYMNETKMFIPFIL